MQEPYFADVTPDRQGKFATSTLHDMIREDRDEKTSVHEPVPGSSAPITDEENKIQSLVPNSGDIGKDEGEEQKPFLVDWDESDAHMNPRNWKRSYRLFMVFVVSLYTLLSPICSTMNAPALDVLQREFHVTSAPVTNMMMSASMLAFTVAPMIYGPMSERIGRKYILQISNIMCATSLTQISLVQCGMWSFAKRRANDHLAVFYGICRLCTSCNRCWYHCGSFRA